MGAGVAGHRTQLPMFAEYAPMHRTLSSALVSKQAAPQGNVLEILEGAPSVCLHTLQAFPCSALCLTYRRSLPPPVIASTPVSAPLPLM